MENGGAREVVKSNGDDRHATRDSVSWLATGTIALSAAATVHLLFRYFQDREPGSIRPDEVAFVLPVILTIGALVSMLAASELRTFRIAEVVRYLTGVAVFASRAGGSGGWGGYAELLFLSALVLELSVVERYPWNLAGSSTVILAVVAIRLAVFPGELQPPYGPGSLPVLVVPGLGIGLLGSQMVRFREMIVGSQRENDALQEVVVNLARANTQYQSDAIVADEHGRSQERRRITRDIHDIVGYTLTNNIMLMESARDMMQENPFGIPKLVDAARANAEEGLERIREALYDLRRQDESLPIGLVAIQRLAKTFGEATGVRVRLDWANAPTRFAEAVDSTLYHLIQESLINSYRHGRVNSVDISCWCEKNMIRIYSRDDGVGAVGFREGIGIAGMRERIELLGGELHVSGSESGFLVEACIPLEVDTHEHA